MSSSVRSLLSLALCLLATGCSSSDGGADLSSSTGSGPAGHAGAAGAGGGANLAAGAGGTASGGSAAGGAPTGGSPAVGGAPSAGSGGSGGATAAGSGGSGAVSSGGSGGSSSGSGGGGGDPTAGALLDPLVIGHSWTYQVTELGIYPLCPSGTGTGTVLSQGPRDGMPDAIAVQSLCANAGIYYYQESGDRVQYDAMGSWVLALDTPVVEGHGWTNGTQSYTWHDAGSVTVPAGTFDNCWNAAEDGGASYTIFCRGVGPIHWHLDELGNGYDAVLTGKNF